MISSPFIAGLAKVVAVGALMAGGAGGIYVVSRTDDGSEDQQAVAETPVQTAATPPAVTGVPATPTPPRAAAATPDGCPPGWRFVDETRFSFCHPPELTPERTVDGNLVTYNLLRSNLPAQPNTFFAAIFEKATRAFDPNIGCAGVSLIPRTEISEEISVTIDGSMHPACYASGTDQDKAGTFAMESIIIDLPTADGFLTVVISYRGPDTVSGRATAELLLSSVELR